MSKRHSIKVCELEFTEGGNTLWIHSPLGATVLRIKTTHKDGIRVRQECENPVAHADIMTDKPITICIP